MLLLVFVAVFQIPAANAQNDLSEKPAYSFHIRNWLPNSNAPASIYCIAQTPDGYLWLGNEFGLWRFDGMYFTNLSSNSSGLFKNQDCNALFLTHDSTLIAGFTKGLILTYKNHKWSMLDSKTVFLEKDITAIAEDSQHNLWIGLAGNGVMCYNRKTSKIFSVSEGLCNNGINLILPGKGDDVWIGTDNGLCLIGKDGLNNYGIKEGLSHPNINGLWIDEENTMWIGSADGHLYYMTNGRIQSWDDKQGKIKSCIKQITGFGKNTLAIATEGQGIIMLNTKTSKSEQLCDSKHLSSNLVYCLFKDREENLWAGTIASGLSRIRISPIHLLNSSNGLSGNFITSIIQSADGSIWVGNSTGGLDRIRDNRIEKMGSKLGLGNKPIYTLATDNKNNIWIGSQTSLIKFDGKTTEHFNEKQGLICSKFWSLLLAKDGRLWIGTPEGIFIFKDGKVASVMTTREGLPSNKIRCFLEDRKGFIWVGTENGGLARIKDGKIKSYGAKQGLPDNSILCLHLDSLNNIWIGTAHEGLVSLNPETETFIPVPTAKLSSLIGYIFQDKSGHIWFAENGELISVKFSNLLGVLKDKKMPLLLQTFTMDTGLLMGVFPGACKLKNGQFWYPSPAGIELIDPENAWSWNSRPVPLIDSLLINNRSLVNQEVYTVDAGLMRFEIHYTAPSFISPEGLSFRYRLKGFDRDWDTAGARRTAYYTNVPPGNYTFEVQVFNNLGELSPATASIKIQVLPFFYQTWWFILLCILAGLAVVILIVEYRIRSVREKKLEALVEARTEEIKKLNEQLEQKVLDRTAQLEASNKELEAFSYSVSHDLKGPVRRIDSITRAFIEDYFSTLDETEKDFLKKITESAGSMNVLIDELLKLSRIVRHDIDKMQVNLSKIVLEINQEIRKLNPGRKVHLMIQEGLLDYCDPKLMRIVFQNLFDNAWKYSSKEKEAVIEFSRTKKDGKTVYMIRDNGVGFDMTYYDKLFTPFQRLHSDDQFTGTGIGLATVKRILLKHGGLIWAESAPGEGTKFYFTLDSSSF